MGGKGSGGHNRKPVERKRRIGNPSGRKLPDLVSLPSITVLPQNQIPEPHRVLLEKYGLRLWNQIWISGAGWLKQNMDTEVILVLCEAIDERQLLRSYIFEKENPSHNESPKPPVPILWRERRALREVDRQIITLLGQIGFSPSERGLLSETEIVRSDFSDLHRRIAKKRQASR